MEYSGRAGAEIQWNLQCYGSGRAISEVRRTHSYTVHIDGGFWRLLAEVYGEPVGQVTSAGWGHALGAPVGLAWAGSRPHPAC